MMVKQRAAVIESSQEDREKVLVTTNMYVHIVDAEQVSVIINFDISLYKNGNLDNKTYLHWMGHTGLFSKKSLAVNMVDSRHSMNILNKIQEHCNKKIKRLDIDDVEEIEKIAYLRRSTTTGTCSRLSPCTGH
eukprot:bmy_14914T0